MKIETVGLIAAATTTTLFASIGIMAGLEIRRINIRTKKSNGLLADIEKKMSSGEEVSTEEIRSYLNRMDEIYAM